VTSSIPSIRSAETPDLDLLRRLVAAEEAERQRIANELHDDAVQALAASVMHLGLLASRVDAVPAEAAYERARGNLEHGLRAARMLLLRLRAPLLADAGPAAALAEELERLGQAAGVHTRLGWRLPERLDPLADVVLFRAAQEAVANALRHAKAGTVTVDGDPEPGPAGPQAVVRVRDDGAGFDPGLVAASGLARTRDRVTLAGGRLELDSVAGHGTTVTIRLPLSLHPAAGA
jgi:signal transduction histidine kinase